MKTKTTMTGHHLYVLIIAHPDDESMFFVPTLRGLKVAKEKVWILCLTTGDYDGLGKIRSKEMMQAGKILGIERTIVCDELKDHPTNRWDITIVQQEIEKRLRTEMEEMKDEALCTQITLISFDQWGVSGHVNHIDTYLGVSAIARKGALEVSRKGGGVGGGDDNIPLEAWSLVSERNLISKYFPILCWILLLLSVFFNSDGSTGIHYGKGRNSDSRMSYYQMYRLHEPFLNWKAMTTHASQFVWYRRLFVVFSTYTYVNQLEKIKVVN